MKYKIHTKCAQSLHTQGAAWGDHSPAPGRPLLRPFPTSCPGRPTPRSHLGQPAVFPMTPRPVPLLRSGVPSLVFPALARALPREGQEWRRRPADGSDSWPQRPAPGPSREAGRGLGLMCTEHQHWSPPRDAQSQVPFPPLSPVGPGWVCHPRAQEEGAGGAGSKSPAGAAGRSRTCHTLGWEEQRHPRELWDGRAEGCAGARRRPCSPATFLNISEAGLPLGGRIPVALAGGSL